MKTSSKPPYRPSLRTQLDVEQFWTTVINPLGWHCERFYFVLVGADDEPHQVINELDELPTPFTGADADRFAWLLAEVAVGLAPGTRWALLYCRPGPGGLTDPDRLTCRLVYEAAHARDVPLEVIHVATDTLIVPAPMDEVAA